MKKLKPFWNPKFVDVTLNPYLIKVTNTTNRTLTDVHLINYDHHLQKKIKYFCPISNVTYDDFLRFLIGQNKPEKIIKKILFVVKNKNMLLIKKQLKDVFHVMQKNVNGYFVSNGYFLSMKEGQQQQDRCILETKPFPLYSETLLKINNLFPKIELTIYLYPTLKK